VGFALTKQKKGKLPEVARYRYKVNLDVEATKLKAESKGFSCHIHEGQPKNKRGKDGYGNEYSLPQYGVTDGALPDNVKIEIAPSVTQIYLFDNPLNPPAIEETTILLEKSKLFLDKLEKFSQKVDAAEKVMNEIAVFSDNATFRFSIETRIYAKTSAIYRLIISSRDVTDHLLDMISKAYMHEISLSYADMFNGNLSQARRKLDLLMKEIEFFSRELVAMARQMKDPRADKWEAEFTELLRPVDYPTWLKQQQNSWLNLGQ
jgi:hypothetical protein